MIDLGTASDANLVVAIARWHEPAMAEAYRRHGGAVHALARRVLRHEPSAEEITQEVFLDLWQHPEKFDSQRGTLRSFLLARTHGKSVDLIRSEESRKGREGAHFTRDGHGRIRPRAPRLGPGRGRPGQRVDG